ncbi:DUF285 domain-containing protein [Pseudoalteromonas sp. OFAV1]|uniref:BspA family leucine-rich repeat surface protein n=1 Tax=Pseudoalteromonas sp. OFAV1 TaxID=2908892 RepID=UPI001F3E6FE5|nr:BspA family leucine-rich repeat surface protein [Pseudoalteromonas sp. OFAV1]MCF2903059.1 DUF285 domain-containing protein [Pseudoalteromonas sp. OFAV1]
MKIKLIMSVLLLGQLTSVHAEPSNVLRFSSSPIQSLNNSGQSNDDTSHPSCTAEQPVVTLDELKNMIAANEDVTNVCTSQITDMSNLFYLKNDFNQDISNWDTSNVTNMYYMFGSALNFNQDLSKWDVSKVTNMRGIFSNCKHFNSDISLWNVENVTDLSYAFKDSSFTGDISNWDTSNVIHKSYWNGGINLPREFWPSSWQ